MTHIVIRRFLVSAMALGIAAVSSSSGADESTHSGRAAVYKNLPANSLEKISSSEVIRSMFGSNGKPVVAPTRIWKVLEHGEKVECLNCIPLVSNLLWDSHAKTREISAWWLRRRIFGVFGPGEIYSQVVGTLGDASQSEQRRVYAANALGEFLTRSGAKYLAAAIRNDESPAVREAAVKALERMNSQGPNRELSHAMADGSEAVRLAAVRAATRVHSFTDVDSVTSLVGDVAPAIRREAAAALGTMRVGDAVDALIALTSPDIEPDAGVRMAAIWSLGQIGDSSAREAVAAAALNDPDPFVRDAARAAGRRLY
ncbi:MAG TPA: HEAT repeat domain-containing protein [Polyangiaceae bacterium]